MAILVWLAVAVVAGARLLEPNEVLKEPLQNGGRIADLVAPGIPTAILVYSPEYCFACIAELAEWEEHERAGHLRLLLILDDEPTVEDLRAMAMLRVDIDGVLSWSKWLRTQRSPREYLLLHGVLLAQGEGASTGADSPVLEYVRKHY
jgi:hypothetical protein